MELAEVLASVIPLLDRTKDFLEKEGGFRRPKLTLAGVSESDDGEKWIITFYYTQPKDKQETYCEAQVSKKSGETTSFRRFECD